MKSEDIAVRSLFRDMCSVVCVLCALCVVCCVLCEVCAVCSEMRSVVTEMCEE